MADFYMVVAVDGASPNTRYNTVEEAQEVAEQIASRTGADVFIMKPIMQASIRRVEWKSL